ncbi:hypothetical protein BLNAU_5785 [Blattamonas nauphoetae]|uniref:Uncharacterized protein n=1 Tax=Blattamonas nauphoetae TaxID=2049346 RepID=A0ABQ9Y656_9EUKA|nr:hypothetical protein BLNAU_5785 [Blattamonas nauphoetae]
MVGERVGNRIFAQLTGSVLEPPSTAHLIVDTRKIVYLVKVTPVHPSTPGIVGNIVPNHQKPIEKLKRPESSASRTSSQPGRVIGMPRRFVLKQPTQPRKDVQPDESDPVQDTPSDSEVPSDLVNDLMPPSSSVSLETDPPPFHQHQIWRLRLSIYDADHIVSTCLSLLHTEDLASENHNSIGTLYFSDSSQRLNCLVLADSTVLLSSLHMALSPSKLLEEWFAETFTFPYELFASLFTQQAFVPIPPGCSLNTLKDQHSPQNHDPGMPSLCLLPLNQPGSTQIPPFSLSANSGRVTVETSSKSFNLPFNSILSLFHYSFSLLLSSAHATTSSSAFLNDRILSRLSSLRLLTHALDSKRTESEHLSHQLHLINIIRQFTEQAGTPQLFLSFDQLQHIRQTQPTFFQPPSTTLLDADGLWLHSSLPRFDTLQPFLDVAGQLKCGYRVMSFLTCSRSGQNSHPQQGISPTSLFTLSFDPLVLLSQQSPSLVRSPCDYLLFHSSSSQLNIGFFIPLASLTSLVQHPSRLSFSLTTIFILPETEPPSRPFLSQTTIVQLAPSPHPTLATITSSTPTLDLIDTAFLLHRHPPPFFTIVKDHPNQVWAELLLNSSDHATQQTLHRLNAASNWERKEVVTTIGHINTLIADVQARLVSRLSLALDRAASFQPNTNIAARKERLQSSRLLDDTLTERGVLERLAFILTPLLEQTRMIHEAPSSSQAPLQPRQPAPRKPDPQFGVDDENKLRVQLKIDRAVHPAQETNLVAFVFVDSTKLIEVRFRRDTPATPSKDVSKKGSTITSFFKAETVKDPKTRVSIILKGETQNDLDDICACVSGRFRRSAPTP